MKDIMIAFFKGFAGLVTAFFIRARSKGFDIMLLTIISGILFGVRSMLSQCVKQR